MLHQTLSVQLPTQSYPIYIGRGLLHHSALFERHLGGKQVMIVTQKNVADLYLGILQRSLSAYDCAVTYLPQGERYKNLSSWRKVIDNLVEKQHERSTTLIALGGGLVGDVAGFAAACYQRGVNYIHLPTTLIAQVDSAIGGKTGVNHAAGKNLIGAFHQPLCVIADLDTLATLPRREFIAGLAEVIKYGVIQDPSFFSWLENNLSALLQGKDEALLHAVSTSASIKGKLVAQDVREQSGLRRLLNFGHTLGHALEALFQYRVFLHGEAVAVGMSMAARLSVAQGWLAAKDQQRIQALLAASALPTAIDRKVDAEKLFFYLMRDKKNQNQHIQWVMLRALGEAFLTDQIRREDIIRLIPRHFLINAVAGDKI